MAYLTRNELIFQTNVSKIIPDIKLVRRLNDDLIVQSISHGKSKIVYNHSSIPIQQDCSKIF